MSESSAGRGGKKEKRNKLDFLFFFFFKKQKAQRCRCPPTCARERGGLPFSHAPPPIRPQKEGAEGGRGKGSRAASDGGSFERESGGGKNKSEGIQRLIFSNTRAQEGGREASLPDEG